MNKNINIKNKKAISEISKFRDKQYLPIDIRFENVYLKRINKLLQVAIFDKNDLYINSSTLWELMQPIGKTGSHNYHNLSPDDIYHALNSLMDPYCVFRVKNGRFAIIPVYISSFKEFLMVVIETNSGLITNIKANVNKIVTIYPKSNIDDYLSKIYSKDILFIKK